MRRLPDDPGIFMDSGERYCSDRFNHDLLTWI